MDSRPPIIDLHAELAKLTMFRGRTPQSTMEDRTGVEEELSTSFDSASFARNLSAICCRVGALTALHCLASPLRSIRRYSQMFARGGPDNRVRPRRLIPG